MDAVIDASALGLSRCRTLTDRRIITTVIAYTAALLVDYVGVGKYWTNRKADVLAAD